MRGKEIFILKLYLKDCSLNEGHSPTMPLEILYNKSGLL
jgi:hypothetical protein